MFDQQLLMMINTNINDTEQFQQTSKCRNFNIFYFVLYLMVLETGTISQMKSIQQLGSPTWGHLSRKYFFLQDIPKSFSQKIVQNDHFSERSRHEKLNIIFWSTLTYRTEFGHSSVNTKQRRSFFRFSRKVEKLTEISIMLD